MIKKLNIALPKGRLSKDVFNLLELAGYKVPKIENGRKLVIDDEINNFSYYFVKPTDVPTYVDRGVCDIGINGMDTLIESGKDLYELLDLGIGRCKMVLASTSKDVLDKQGELVIATKFPIISNNYFKASNQAVSLIKLNGSVELGPIVNLSDAIIDIYETGSTLHANGLKVIDEVLPISSYLVANKASYRIKNKEINDLIESLNEVI